MGYTWLAPLLNEIADVIGVDGAMRLAELRGGTRISIPRRAQQDHWIVQALGPDDAQKLCDHFAVGNSGAVLDLPVGPASAQCQIQRRVDRLIEQGASANEIARTVGVHRTTVFRRKANLTGGKAPADDRQKDLFE